MVAGALAALLWWVFLALPVAGMVQSVLPVALQQVASRDFGGFMLSIIIGVTGIALSLPLGIMLALGRKSDMPLIKVVCVGFIEFIRGVPLITLLFTASLLLNYFLPPGTNFDIILRVIIMVTLFAAAYMAEVIRGGLAALPRGQYEAADALGLDYWKAHAADHHAAGAENLDPRDREHLYRAVQGYHAGGVHRAAGSDRAVQRHSRRYELERDLLGTVRFIGLCSSSSASACRAIPCIWSAS
jgi:His/Glu/Gln/Arg/opine family amino acid ABC transporter permease subunit